jgi:hypothetical protein
MYSAFPRGSWLLAFFSWPFAFEEEIQSMLHLSHAKTPRNLVTRNFYLLVWPPGRYAQFVVCQLL